jgi:hypothetical protein
MGDRRREITSDPVFQEVLGSQDQDSVDPGEKKDAFGEGHGVVV